MLAVIVCEKLKPADLMLVQKSDFDSADTTVRLRCFLQFDRQLPALERLRLIAQGLMGIGASQSKFLQRGELSVLGYFDCCDLCVIRIENGSLIEKVTGESVGKLTGTRITETMSFDEVLNILRSEGELIDEFQVIFRTPAGQIIELGPEQGQWRCIK